jgi:CHAD domain-containing protein
MATPKKPTEPKGEAAAPVATRRRAPRSPAAGDTKTRHATDRAPLALDTQKPLPEAVARLFGLVVERAREAALEAPSDPVTAVHEFRKCIRRGEAVIRLVAQALPVQVSRELRRGLKRAMKGTSSLRDTDVELQTIAGLELGPELRPTLDRLLTLVAQDRDAAREEARAAKLLAANKAALDSLPGLLAESLPADLSWNALEWGFGTTYRAARRALRAAEAKLSDDRVHTFRLKAKPVRYQLEVLGDGWGKEAPEVRKAVEEVTRQLGAVADLVAVCKRLRERRRELAGAEPGRARRALGEMVRARSVEALRTAAGPLGTRARRFARRVVRPLASDPG